MAFPRGKRSEPGRAKASGFRPWPNKIVQLRFTPHKDTFEKLNEIQEITNRKMASIIRILLDKALGLESDPRDIASNRDDAPHAGFRS
jgi:hypothetical protein